MKHSSIQNSQHTCPMFDMYVEGEVIYINDAIDEPPSYHIFLGHEERFKQKPDIAWWMKAVLTYCPFCGARIM